MHYGVVMAGLEAYRDAGQLIALIARDHGRNPSDIFERLRRDNREHAAMLQAARQVAEPTPTRKTVGRRRSTALRPYDGTRRCPRCPSTTLYVEPICPGCADGRAGWRWRLHCGECDYTEMFARKDNLWQSQT